MQKAQTAINYEAFLREHLNQPHSIMRYELAHETLWVKCASKGNPALNYWLLSALAKLFGIEPEELLRAAEVKDEGETEG